MAEQGRIAGIFDSFDRLSTREKAMVGGLLGALVITAVVVIWMIIGGQIDELETRNAQVRSTLGDVMIKKDTFLQQKAILDAHKDVLDNNRLRLVKEMESQASALGFDIEDFKESERPLTENFRSKRNKGKKVKDLVEESQTVTIRRISLKQLTSFMAALEGRREPVKVTRLSVHTLSSDRQMLREVRMTVATYRNKEVNQ